MKKVMSILTAAVLVIGAAAMVSFTVKEKSEAQTKAWFYVDAAENPILTEGSMDISELECDHNPAKICAKEFNLSPDSPYNPTTPTGAVKTGVRQR